MSEANFEQSVLFGFKSQYLATYKMLRQCIELCPEDLWIAHETRPFWRIAYHGLFYADYYMQPSEHHLKPWEKHRKSAANLWLEEGDEDGELKEAPYTREELLGYCDASMAKVESNLKAFDIKTAESGFPWYPMSKFEHQLVCLRHLMGHVGQLSELLMARGIDIDWVGRVHG